MTLPAPVGYLYWYTTSIILFILTLYNVLYKLFHHARSKGFIRTASSHDSRIGRVWRTGRALVDKHVLLAGIRRPPLKFWKKRPSKWQIMPSTEVWWRVGYSVGFLVLAFYRTGWDRHTYANQAAWLAVAQIPLIIALAGKNNLISFLTGIPYDKLNYIHRAAGNLCLSGVWIHAGGHWSLSHGWSKASWSSALAHWGFVGIFSITLLSLISIQPFRRYVFEFFLALHIALVALMLAAFVMHWKAMDVWLYPGVGLWAADRILRLLRIVYYNHIYPSKAILPPEEPSSPLSPKRSSNCKTHTTAQITLLTPSTLLLTIPRPSPRLSWNAGQHFYISIPGVSRWPWEGHPFTAASVPGMMEEDGAENDQLAFIVRVRDGFTKRLLRYVEENLPGGGYGRKGMEKQAVGVRAAVEGPYGPRNEVREYDGVLIFAGGSGISFGVATLLQIIRDAKKGKSRVKHVTIVWMVTSRLHLDWITPLLSPHLKNLPPSLNVTLKIHITRPPIPLSSPCPSALPPPALRTSTLSNPSEHLHAQTELEDYLHRRVHERSEKHRRKRRWSVFSWASWGPRMGRDSAKSGVNTRRGTHAEIARGAVRKESVSEPTTGSQTSSTSRRSSHGEIHHPPPTNFAWSEHYTSDRMPNAQYISPIHSDHSGSPSATPMRRLSTAPMPPVMEGDELVLSEAAPLPGIEEVPGKGTAGARSSSPTSGEFTEEGDLATRPRTLSPPPFPERRRHVSISDAPPLISPSPRQASSASVNFDRPRPSILLTSLKLRNHRSSSHAPGLLLDPELLAPPMSRSSSAESVDSTTSASSGRSLASFTAPDTPPSIPDLLPVLGLGQDSTTEESSLEHISDKEEEDVQRPSTPTLLLSQLSSATDTSPEEVLQGLALIGSIPDPQKRRESLEQWIGGVEGDLRKKANVLLGLDGEGGVVRWKTGRANLRGEIRGMMDIVSLPSGQSFEKKGASPQKDAEKNQPESVGERAKIWVGVCGPRSLLDSSTLAVREELSGKAVWGGGVRIDFHAESFGW
ncbi:hypothetical protein L198_06016 [Cryptococcus wingfieldii CBS 7118]|uniref:ferric-chelate reductase (NADPH) n=1 Tax=Cryptococcus wingfieldii CBS 7118 TaxID=1295528 RepID=A0A1E3IQ20_9TREE|nr:hypothetical protein L198_06016 [Cryptococcus wingfieldii CBS 7118]ODN90700.1 hypothetical protein L198_06016 [Cryptococcus wingfieldii CBS 7118]